MGYNAWNDSRGEVKWLVGGRNVLSDVEILDFRGGALLQGYDKIHAGVLAPPSALE